MWTKPILGEDHFPLWFDPEKNQRCSHQCEDGVAIGAGLWVTHGGREWPLEGGQQGLGVPRLTAANSEHGGQSLPRALANAHLGRHPDMGLRSGTEARQARPSS